MIDQNTIPQHWKIVKLEDLVDAPKQDLVDGPFGSNLKANEYIESGIPVLKIQNIKPNKFLDKKICFVSEEKAQSLKRHSFASGDIIITKLGDPLGLCCKVPEKYPFGIIVADLIRLRPNKQKVFDSFLVYIINSEIVQKQFKNITKGTTRSRVNLTIVRDLKIPLPNLSEQQQIVSKIEELFSELDKGKQQLETVKQQLKSYRQAVLKWAFEGRFTNKNIKEGQLPEGWKWVKVKDVCNKIIGGGTPSTQVNEFWTGNIPWISSADILGIKDVRPRRMITENAVKNSATNILPKGGIIVVTRVGLGKLAIAPFDICFSQDSQGLILNEEIILKEYALLFLQKEVQNFKLQSRGTTINGVTKKQLAELNLILPSLSEQSHIIQEIETRLSVCDKMEETIENSLRQVESLRQSILKQAFEGKLL